MFGIFGVCKCFRVIFFPGVGCQAVFNFALRGILADRVRGRRDGRPVRADGEMRLAVSGERRDFFRAPPVSDRSSRGAFERLVVFAFVQRGARSFFKIDITCSAAAMAFDHSLYVRSPGPVAHHLLAFNAFLFSLISSSYSVRSLRGLLSVQRNI